MIGTTEIIIIAIVVVLLFGASSIPKIAKSIGQAKGEFEKGIKDGTQKKEKDAKDLPKSNSFNKKD